MRLTIFQRMLVAPVLTLLLLCGYLVVSYQEHRRANQTVEQIRDNSLPVMELTVESVQLFETIVSQFKDAVLAGEEDWLENTKRNRRLIERNFTRIASYREMVPADLINRLQSDFRHYHGNAYELSLLLLGHDGQEDRQTELIENVERYHKAVNLGLEQLRVLVDRQMLEAVEATDQRLQHVLVLGISLGGVVTILVISLTFVLSMTTRRSLREMIMGMRDLAKGNPDFSKRLKPSGKDELSELVRWFNVLSHKLEKDYKKIEQLSITDRLTQLYNRTRIDQLFGQEIKRSLRYQAKFSVILLDVDYFKSVNDKYGHMVGDSVLQELAELLRSGVRDTDHTGRWGGEEFIIIAPVTDLSDALSMAEKLRKMIEEFEFTGVGHKTASFGVASFQEGDDEDSLTQRADQALYLAKQRGRNQVISELEVE
jgi:diguanylate cyclase (GGDEF)-like protein